MTEDTSVVLFPARAAHRLGGAAGPLLSMGRSFEAMRARLERESPSATNPGDSTARSIITMLGQAAEAAKRNEERAKAQAQHWYQHAQNAEARLQALEAEVQQLERRARTAEEALEQINGAVQDILIEPLLARNQTGAA